jgi:hypothetical protein
MVFLLQSGFNFAVSAVRALPHPDDGKVLELG